MDHAWVVIIVFVVPRVNRRSRSTTLAHRIVVAAGKTVGACLELIGFLLLAFSNDGHVGVVDDTSATRLLDFEEGDRPACVAVRHRRARR